MVEKIAFVGPREFRRNSLDRGKARINDTHSERLLVRMGREFAAEDRPEIGPIALGARRRVEGNKSAAGFDVMLECIALRVAAEGLVVAVCKYQRGILAQIAVSEDLRIVRGV